MANLKGLAFASPFLSVDLNMKEEELMYERLYTLSPLYKKLVKIDEEYKVMLPQDERVSDRLEMTDMGLANQSYYLRMWGGYPVYQNTDVSFFHEPEKLLQDMESHLQKAQKFIFLECHICENSVIWNGIAEILKERAANGVEVRILYDGTGSKARRHDKFIGWMEKKNISCKVFHSRKGMMKLNYSDYRKILVIDGKYAYTGDYEFTNDQFHLEKEKQKWHFSGICLTGDAVRSLTFSFLKMWNAMEETTEDPVPYLLKAAYRAGDAGFVQPFATSPMKSEMLGKNMYLNMIRNARKYLYITLPEELTDADLKQELVFAAKRGVRIFLILPERKEKKEQKPEWDASGMIRIFYYTEARLKMRIIVCDDQVACVGNLHTQTSAIMHMFENGCWFSLCRTVLEVKNVFEKMLPYCRESV